MSYSINTEKCYNCHQCMDRCPVRAIDDHTGVFVIDSEKCIECGLCGRTCHFGAVLDPQGNTAEPADIPAHDPQELSADLVVVGGGAAGIMTAVRAAHESGSVSSCWKRQSTSEAADGTAEAFGFTVPARKNALAFKTEDRSLPTAW